MPSPCRALAPKLLSRSISLSAPPATPLRSTTPEPAEGRRRPRVLTLLPLPNCCSAARRQHPAVPHPFSAALLCSQPLPPSARRPLQAHHAPYTTQLPSRVLLSNTSSSPLTARRLLLEQCPRADRPGLAPPSHRPPFRQRTADRRLRSHQAAQIVPQEPTTSRRHRTSRRPHTRFRPKSPRILRRWIVP